jgi:hypothetical protein
LPVARLAARSVAAAPRDVRTSAWGPMPHAFGPTVFPSVPGGRLGEIR